MPHPGPWYQSQPCEAAASGLKPDADVPAADYRQHPDVLLAGLYAALLSEAAVPCLPGVLTGALGLLAGRALPASAAVAGQKAWVKCGSAGCSQQRPEALPC